MKSLKAVTSIGTAGLVAFAVLLSTNASTKPQVTRPMHINGSGTIQITITDYENMTGTWTGSESGQATHLGRYRLQYGGTFYFTSADSVWEGAGSFTAANGDQLDFDVSIVCDGSGETGVMEFTDGTGRFAGASGSVDLTSMTDPVTGAYTTSGTGTVTF